MFTSMVKAKYQIRVCVSSMLLFSQTHTFIITHTCKFCLGKDLCGPVLVQINPLAFTVWQSGPGHCTLCGFPSDFRVCPEQVFSGDLPFLLAHLVISILCLDQTVFEGTLLILGTSALLWNLKLQLPCAVILV